MFGYLNLTDPRDIADSEAQEHVNCRVDKGYLEYATFAPTGKYGRSVLLPGGFTGIGSVQVEMTTDFPVVGSPRKRILGTPDVLDSLGIFGTLTPPTFTAYAGGIVGIAAGTYTYKMELYSGDTRFVERSGPFFGAASFSVTISDTQHVRVTGVPDPSALFPNKADMEWRFYRCPTGGSEFLYCGKVLVSDVAAPFHDYTPDASLGEALDTNILCLDPVNTYVYHILWWANRLVMDMMRVGTSPIGRILAFSEASRLYSFPADFYESVSGNVRVVGVFGEALVVFTDRDTFIIYGSTPGSDGDFTIKNLNEIAGKQGPRAGIYGVLNHQAMIAGFKNDVVGPNYPDGTLADWIDGVFSFNGSGSQRISSKVDKLFPCLTPSYLVSGTYWGEQTKSQVIENRFFVMDITPYTYPVVAGLTPATIAANVKQLGFDSMAQGFFMCDSTATFRWRSKEFSETGKITQLRRFYVVGEGQFDVEVYAGGNLVTTHSLNLPSQTRVPLTCAPFRANTFSFRFIGQPGAKVYEYGRLE